MKTINALVLMASVLLTGCETPLEVEPHRMEVAAKLGVAGEKLLFVSHGDVARADELDVGYSEDFKGIFAMTETDIYWGHGDIDSVDLDDVERIPIAQISEAALDYDLVQLRVNGELMIFRPHAWNRYEGDVDRSVEVLRLLWQNHKVPTFVATRSYRSPADFHSSLGTGLYGEASAEASAAQNQLEAADAQWSLNAGNDGVPLTPPSERMSPRGEGI